MNEEGAGNASDGKRRLPVDRRGLLTALGGVGAVAGASFMATAGRSDDTTVSDTVGADRSFELRRRWRETLPDAEWSEHNRLPLLEDEFDGSTATEWRAMSPDAALDVSTAEGTFVARANRGPAVETWTRDLEIAAPWVAISATVGDAAGAAPAFGIAKDDGNAILGEFREDGATITTAFGGRRSVTTLGGDVPAAPFEALLVLMGDRASLLTRRPGATWSYRGDAAWTGSYGGDLYERGEWARWNPCLRADAAESGRVEFEAVRVFHALQFGLRDPTVVTEPDGTPVVRDGECYLTATCGSLDHRGYQVVLAMDTETYAFDLRGALWAESVPGHASNYVASHLMYDPDADEFVQFWSGFGNGPHEPYSAQKCWVSRTGANLLEGTHVLECELMNLPRGWTGRQHDPFVIRDEDAGTWRCVHNENAIFRVTVSETDDDSFTGGWETVGSYGDYVNQIEGGKFARIDGEIALAHADQGSPSEMTLAAYPDPSAGRVPIALDVPPGDVAPHPSIVQVPDGEGGSKCLLVTMDGARVYGLGESSHGALCVYEDTSRGTGDGASGPTRPHSTADPELSAADGTEPG